MSSLSSVLLPTAYSFNPFSLPVLIIGIATGLIGFVALIREHASRVVTAFFGLTTCVAFWLISFAVIYSCKDASLAAWWARKVEHLGVAFIPAAILNFALEMTTVRNRFIGLVWTTMGASFLWYIAFSETDWLITGVVRYSWGYYPQYSWIVLLFLAYFVVLLAFTMVLFRAELRTAVTEGHRRRMRLLMIAFGIAYVGALDFVASYRVPLYPFGFAGVLGFLIVLGRVLARYRFVDITPAFMGEEIMRTMSDALFVLDPQGIVRLVNDAAAKMLGLPRERLAGNPVGELPGLREVNDRLPSLMKKGSDHFELRLDGSGAGVGRTVSISASVIGDRRRADAIPIGVVCVGRDVTERIKDEVEIRRNVERLSALHTIDRAITGSMDLRLTLNVLLDQVINQLHPDAASILLYNEESNLLELAASHGLPDGAGIALSIPLGEGLPGQAAVDRKLRHTTSLVDTEEPSLRIRRLVALGLRSYYALPLIAKGRLRGILEVFHRNEFVAEPKWLEFLVALAEQAAIAVDNAVLFQELERTNTELRLAYDSTLEGWALALELRDIETEGHSRRVSAMTVKLAQALGMSSSEIVHVRRGALLHDVGKMGIPDSILLKEGALSDEEWYAMRRHPIIAYEMLKRVPFLRPALDIPYCHHERWDGTGYPRGLAGDAIPFSARMFMVVDVWDALNSARSYRDAWPEDRVREYIHSLSGTHFDPSVVDCFVRLDWKI